MDIEAWLVQGSAGLILEGSNPEEKSEMDQECDKGDDKWRRKIWCYDGRE
jgi:hypothetical protein